MGLVLLHVVLSPVIQDLHVLSCVLHRPGTLKEACHHYLHQNLLYIYFSLPNEACQYPYEYNNCIGNLILTQKCYHNNCTYMAFLPYEYNNCIDNLILTQKCYHNNCTYMAFLPCYHNNCTNMVFTSIWFLSSVKYQVNTKSYYTNF